MRTVWLNGEFLPEDEARVPIFDRALLFGQGVYEVTPVIDGRSCNWPHHAARLARSMATARIADQTDWPTVIAELIARNSLSEGRVYLQVTGGAPADRDFLSPHEPVPATRFAFTQVAALIDNPAAHKGLRVILHPDGRWALRSAKTTQLLYAVLAKEAARDAGYDDAWLVENGVITEATSANAHIINARGVLVSHPVDHGVLPGVTRINVVAIARAMGLEVEERPFTPDELFAAREAFISSAGALVTPVVEVDGKPIGNGGPGTRTAELRQRYIALLKAG
ncbi:aminotransferase class IV [Novosphingobium sp.]|uniref:aminotransferase class IV n=1 Tax=Novosphingobium sp. TaxID=1874826 RepID=UPI0025DCF6FE|nr:aminotransferase class IV [Novosphingobium sp.]MCC6925735.1 aminotransferase class IV [Novosphingobium sp.]